ncbi:MAG: sulfur relay protein DsrC [Sedimenticola sp.]|uniref:Sulfur relay protein DsrC n=1 Tax=Sedimenticola thiotaurini TaxID=1543721 RepID=A0A558CYB2_9GAMM|nr:sulfur relay protein DsrC [Sedimenticola sp.]TVT53747.1 MAG: sulfur relay protein DsrC [Sedimenticola thiotaurini]MCW8920187.1 sulfur relay protein DsrC [Sedimenticola sp.]MCW8946192.1 sulfur relay protein DsrC [Sedimenticola sp.]MCW8948488.1 sulfur relay protein DsrC [Sedimenticola sp.]
MLLLSEVMIQSPDVDSFEELIELIKIRRQSEMFFRIDVKPPFSDTPDDWEDRLEAAFT